MQRADPGAHAAHGRCKGADCLVVGAGIGGLAAALALARAGQRVRVFAQVAAIGRSRRPQHHAQMPAVPSCTWVSAKRWRGSAARHQWAPSGTTPTGEVLVTLAQDQSREKYGVPLYHVHRADLHAALAAALRDAQGDVIHTGRALESLQQGSQGVVARFVDGSTASGDCLIGADGIHAATRRLLFGADRPNFTGYIAWRGLIPGERVDPALIDPQLCHDGRPPPHVHALPAAPRPARQLRRDRAPRGVDRGRLVGAATVQEVLDEFADFEPRVRALLELTPPERLFKWGLFDRDPLPSWTAAA